MPLQPRVTFQPKLAVRSLHINEYPHHNALLLGKLETPKDGSSVVLKKVEKVRVHEAGSWKEFQHEHVVHNKEKGSLLAYQLPPLWAPLFQKSKPAFSLDIQYWLQDPENQPIPINKFPILPLKSSEPIWSRTHIHGIPIVMELDQSTVSRSDGFIDGRISLESPSKASSAKITLKQRISACVQKGLPWKVLEEREHELLRQSYEISQPRIEFHLDINAPDFSPSFVGEIMQVHHHLQVDLTIDGKDVSLEQPVSVQFE